MTTCSCDPELLTMYCFGDLSPEESHRVETHLATCASCEKERREIAGTLDALDPAKAYPRESEVDWDRFAVATVAKARGAGNVVPFRRRVAAWATPANLARAAVLVLAVGVGAVVVSRLDVGKLENVEPPIAAGQTAAMPEDFRARLEFSLARSDTRRYLQESRMVLLSVLETPVRCSKNEVDLSVEQEKSRRLLRRKRLLEDDLMRPELARAADLCNRLEGILAEISTLDGCTDIERIEQLRDAVRRNQLLVKIGHMEGELEGFSA